MKKKFLSVLLALCMIVSFVPCVASAAASGTNIKIGDYLQMGTYYGEPILWRCVDIDANGPLMLSDKILCIKAFDAKYSANNTTGSHSRSSYRQSCYSNYWGDSNMRSWLNSTASAGNVRWLCGNPPIKEQLWSGYNAYDQEAGFLSNFTQSERNAMKEVRQKSLLSYPEYKNGIATMGTEPHEGTAYMDNVVGNYDTAYAEYVTDKMFCMDVKQVNAVYNNSGILGKDYYIGEPTTQCVANSEYKSSSLATDKKWDYWLRSPYSDNYGLVRVVCSGGYVRDYIAYHDYGGVRPAFYLNLSSSIKAGSGTVRDPYIIETTAGDVSQNKTEYAEQHLSFAQSNEYRNLVNQRWGHIIGEGLNTPIGNTSETIYNILNIGREGLNFFDNPYDPIVADLILQESGISLNSIELSFKNEVQSNISKLETLCKMHSGDWEASTEYTTALESLIKEPDDMKKSNPAFYELCKTVFSSIDQAELDKLLNAYGVASKVQGALDKYANVVNWVAECLKFNAMVSAYKQTDDDFKAMLFFAVEYMNNFASDDMLTNAVYSSYFEEAVNKYARFLEAENTTELLFNEYFAKGMKRVQNVFGGALETRFTNYIVEGLGLSGTALTWAEAVKFAYKTGMTLGDTITKNGKIMDCRELIKATYFLENASYKLLENFKYDLEKEPDDLSASHFDAAYKLFQRTNIYSIKTYKKYLEHQQSAFCRGLFHGFNWKYNAAEIEIADILIAQWEKAKCHSSEMGISLMSNGRTDNSIKTFKISGNNDVVISDISDNVIFRVDNGKILEGTDSDGISATILNNVIVIADANADDHILKVSSKKDTKADVSIQSFDTDGSKLQSALYKNVNVSANKTLQCTYNSYDNNCSLTSNGEIVEPQNSSTDDQFVPIERLTLSQNDVVLDINEMVAIEPSISPLNASSVFFEWCSDNNNVAVVDNYGNITAKGAGNAKIYCSATDGSGISQAVNVTVKAIGAESFTIYADAGYYAQTSDSADKEGVIAFNAFFDKYEVYVNQITEYGIYIYKTGDEENKISISAPNADELLAAKGKFYATVENIPVDRFADDVIAVPYIVINESIVTGEPCVHNVLKSNKWLGIKPIN